MATINNAVQEMVDHLVTKMRSNQKLSAEEQTLVSNAIQKLSSSADLEAAIVAIAQEHLGEATGHINNASDLVKELQADLLAQSSNLSLLPELETKFNEITENLVTNVEGKLDELPTRLSEPQRKLGEMHFVLDYYDNTAALLKDINQNYGAYNAISLVNYDTGTFHLYYDGGSETNANNPAVILEMDPQGAVKQSPRATSLSSSNNANYIGFFVNTDKQTHLFTYQNDTKLLSLYKQNELNVLSSHNVDYFRVYQSPQTKELYIVDSELLHVFDGLAWLKKLDQTFGSESEFVEWAAQNNLVALNDLVIEPNPTSSSNMNTSTGYGTSLAYLEVKRPPVLLDLSYQNSTYKTLDSIPTQKLARNRMSSHFGRTDNLLFTRSFKSRVHLPDTELPIKAIIESVTPNNNNNSGHGNYDAQFYPQMVGFSPIHRAMIIFQRVRFYYSGSSIVNTGLYRVYYA
ncbi:hypothetical protein PSECIP111854_02063 [Pseudoalteromonas sp. CIP111854]|uniref:Uncharacterized protein n=1 Tax=Pseudoalteromonas holothuriae TaxID=2963714 RepID=A0A9W4VZB9_9GAMM|nr:hypothetical protein [Pseudoalteromonas sp. CIP111854]CAH9057760.1 hypothetical protein PSECIP111854_02063 [Pseudoalteromonas sp. CIP111854]